MLTIKRAFTLIELLVVIGVLAVLMAGVVALINPVEKTRQANDAKVQNDVAQFITSIQSFAAQQPDGSFPCMAAGASCPNTTQGMTTNNFTAIGPAGTGELTTLPAPPNGSNYYYYSTPGGNARPQTGFVTYGRLLSGKYNTNACPAGQNGYWTYDSRVGRPCGICLAAAPGAYPAAAVTCVF